MRITPLGVMQGRLLPKYRGRYQAHPIGYWQNEFYLAADLGLELIEFILDFTNVDQNPLMSEEGIGEIIRISEKTGVGVKTICADYFIEAPLHSDIENTAKSSLSTLKKLVQQAAQLNCSDIVLPCVDQSSLYSHVEVERFVKAMGSVVELAEENGINLALETDLSPGDFAALLDKFDSQNITVNYDIGNSAALNFDHVEEIETYGSRISDIHLKDRELGGGSVILGTGNADFDSFFGALENINYKGPFIMQAYRDDEGVNIFKQQLDWLKQYTTTLSTI